MNWITKVVRPRIKGLIGGKDGGRGDTPENLWKKCPSCNQMIFHRDLVANLNVCPNCDHHMRIGPAERFAYSFDAGSFTELPPPGAVLLEADDIASTSGLVPGALEKVLKR